jgi:hypothetical protein
LINSKDKVWNPELEIDVKLDSPIVRWKELLGDMNPEEAVK